jgi:hypothetical protein
MAATSLGVFVSAVLTVIKDDTLKLALPIILSFLQNVESNPSQLNIVAQVTSLEAQLLAALPNLEMAVVKDVVAIIQTEITALTAVVTPAPAAAS